jgi:ribosomal protein S27E
LTEPYSKYSKNKYALRKELKIHCIECKNKVDVPGIWLSGETDIRCVKCGALMTLTLENGEFKRLILKQATKYTQDYLSRL